MVSVRGRRTIHIGDKTKITIIQGRKIKKRLKFRKIQKRSEIQNRSRKKHKNWGINDFFVEGKIKNDYGRDSKRIYTRDWGDIGDLFISPVLRIHRLRSRI